MAPAVILIILDGFGIGDRGKGDAISAANTPNLDTLFKENPTTFIVASGKDVGLPEGQMGNSEVGHTNIGAGRIVHQDFTRISHSIEDGSFFSSTQIENTLKYVKSSGGRLHIAGLLSDGGVHSHISHLYALLELVKKFDIEGVCVHAWTDGRDVSPNSGINFIKDCEEKLSSLGIGRIETICGRYYAMDRDNRWERISMAYDAMANGNGCRFTGPEEFIKCSYEDNITDEFVEPGVRGGYCGVSEEDAIICFNFRPDRAREITRAFVDRDLRAIDAKRAYPSKYLCLTEYDAEIAGVSVAYKPEKIKNTLGEYISSLGLRQLRMAETEKYAHVTFFFSGGTEKKFKNEDRILIHSPKAATYDLVPQMSAYELTDAAIEGMQKQVYDLIVINYANCDMVGHTGVFSAAVEATEAVDKCVGRVLKSAKETGYIAVVTADHGNAEKMVDEEGKPFTTHTTNLVPFCVFNYKCKLVSKGKLSDIAPTILDILKLPVPKEMDGKTLLHG